MKQLSTAALFLAALLTATAAIAQNTYQVFGPVDTRVSTNTSNTPFGTTTLQLDCTAATPVTAVLSSSGTPTSTAPSLTYANVFTDNFIGLSVNGATQVDVCQGGYVDTQVNCFTSSYTGAYGGLNGDDPDTFVATYGVSAIDISADLLAGQKQTAEFQLEDSGVSLGASSVYLITNCTQNGVAPGGSLSGNTVTSTSLTQGYNFDSTPGQRVEFTSDYTAAEGSGDLTIVANTLPMVNNQGIEPSTWPPIVAGTSFATTNCIPNLGLLDPSGNPLCELSTILCTNSLSSTPLGDNCPQSTAKNVEMLYSFDASQSSVTNFPFGTGLGFLEGSDNWPTASCSFIGPETGKMCPQNPITSFLGDYRSGSGTGSTNSTFTAVTGVPLPFTLAGFLPYSFGWSNSNTVNLGFLTVPPFVPPPNNNFIAAPIATLTYGIDSPAPYPDTSLPIPGDVTLTNSISCPSVPTAGLAKPLVETTTVSLAEGPHQMHFFATDCAGTEELVFTPNPANLGNWATFKTLAINVDTTKPYVTSGPTLSPAGPYLWNQAGVKASYDCVDPVASSNGTAPSGVVVCGPSLLSLVAPTPNTGTLSSPVSTSAVGPHTFTVNVRDLAGNVGATASVPYTVGYSFTGFLSPVQNPPALNAESSGSTVSLKFSLGGNAGLSILAGNPTSVPIACTAPYGATGAAAATGGGLTYSGGTYAYGWATSKSWKGTCRQFVLQLTDGTIHAANFSFD